MIEFIWRNGHIECLKDGEFLFSADTIIEARKELENENADGL